MRISDWSSDVCSSDLGQRAPVRDRRRVRGVGGADAARYRVATAARGAVVRALRTRADRDLVHRATARPRQRSRAFLIFWSTCVDAAPARAPRSEEHTSELQSLMRISYAVFCLKKQKTTNITSYHTTKDTETSLH